jgi:D-psicose/D-tagatose/L-ribulose 3-epimerase
MKKQNFEQKSAKIRSAFQELKKNQPARLKRRLTLSWSNWGFGIESMQDSAARLEKAAIRFIELPGNHHGPDLGYRARETRRILGDHGIQVSGICGLFSPDNDLSSNRPIQQQAAVDYLRREITFAAEVGAGYIIVVPGAVGRPSPYDDTEFERSVATLQRVADDFAKHRVKAAVEPIRSSEVSFCHTVAAAKRYIEAVGHPAVKHINGDVYHMQAEESHIGEALLSAGSQLLNIHLADSNRCALGEGSLDLDTVIMALYLIGYNQPGRCATPEPLGPGGNPYPALFGRPDQKALDRMVMQTAAYFREREDELRA